MVSGKLDNTSEDVTSDDVSYKKMLTDDEFNIETKKSTHDGLLKLGETLQKKRLEEGDLQNKKIKKQDILDKYNFKEEQIDSYVEDLSKNKDVLLLRIHGIVKDLSYLQDIDKSLTLDFEKKIKIHVQDIALLKEENISLIDECEELEKKNEEHEKNINGYWKMRVQKLRNRVTDNRLYILRLFGLCVFTNIHTIILCNVGFNAYFNFWFYVIDWLNFMIYHIVFFLPNMYYYLTDIDNYIYLFELSMINIIHVYDYLLHHMYNGFNYLYFWTIYGCKSAIIYTIENNILISTLVCGFILIKYRNRLFRNTK